MTRKTATSEVKPEPACPQGYWERNEYKKINYFINRYPIKLKHRVIPKSEILTRNQMDQKPILDKNMLLVTEHLKINPLYSKRLPSGLIYFGPQVDLFDKPSNRYHVFNFEQINRLNNILQSTLTISPRPIEWDYLLVPKFTPILVESCEYCSNTIETSSVSRVLLRKCCCCDATPIVSVKATRSKAKTSRVHTESMYRRPQCMPILYVKLITLIRALRDRLNEEQIIVRDIRMNGGAAGYVIDEKSENTYSDLDLIFSVDLSTPNTFAKIKSVVFATIAQFVADTFASGYVVYNCTPQQCSDCAFSRVPVSQNTWSDPTNPTNTQQSSDPAHFHSHRVRDIIDTASNRKLPCYSQSWCSMLEDESCVKNYVQKMVRIHKPSSKTADSWSLFTLGYRTVEGGKTVDIKFVDRMHRQFEFTVDSFQILLDSMLIFNETCRKPLQPNYYPIVVAKSVSGSFQQALNHLHERLIFTPRPEEIRGGGLLKYCKLLADGYRPSRDTDVLAMERYMCSRFFIDFPDIVSQNQRLSYFLNNHFENNDELKVAYLQILHEVVSHSTVCLMNHERRQTLCLIRMYLHEVLARDKQKHSVVTFEEMFSDDWILESVVYGTAYFPKQFLLDSHNTESGLGKEIIPNTAISNSSEELPEQSDVKNNDVGVACSETKETDDDSHVPQDSDGRRDVKRSLKPVKLHSAEKQCYNTTSGERNVLFNSSMALKEKPSHVLGSTSVPVSYYYIPTFYTVMLSNTTNLNYSTGTSAPNIVTNNVWKHDLGQLEQSRVYRVTCTSPSSTCEPSYPSCDNQVMFTSTNYGSEALRILQNPTPSTTAAYVLHSHNPEEFVSPAVTVQDSQSVLLTYQM